MREVAREADASLGQVQHYFGSRTAMLVFAMEFAAEQTSRRITRSLDRLGSPPHPRDVLRVTLMEMLPLHPNARATSRMSAAYTLEALHNPELHEQARIGLHDGRALTERLIRQAIAEGYISSDREPAIETNLLLALTGFTPLLDFDVIDPDAAQAAIDYHLDRLFDCTSQHRKQ